MATKKKVDALPPEGPTRDELRNMVGLLDQADSGEKQG